jgi:hypothetical protein
MATEVTDWIIRVGDGLNLSSSSKYGIWGIQTLSPTNKHFINNVKPGDRLWFVKSKSQGKLLAVATYRSHNERVIGPLVNLTMTNEELGWVVSETDRISDTEIHYTDLYGLSKCELLTHIKGAASIRKYDEKCMVNLPVEYSYIVRYSMATVGV